MKVREIAYPSDNFSHYIFYTINLLVKIRVQHKIEKLAIDSVGILLRSPLEISISSIRIKGVARPPNVPIPLI